MTLQNALCKLHDLAHCTRRKINNSFKLLILKGFFTW